MDRNETIFKKNNKNNVKVYWMKRFSPSNLIKNRFMEGGKEISPSKNKKWVIVY